MRLVSDLKLKLVVLCIFLHQKVSRSYPSWLKIKINAKEIVTPNFRLGQFFFTEESSRDLVDKLDRFENPCCLCTPSLGHEWYKRGKEVRVLDIDRRFGFLPGYRHYDLKNPTSVDETYDVIILDPIFFPPEILLRAIDTITKQNYQQRLIILYKTELEEPFLAAFKEYGLFPSHHHPHYSHVTDAGRKAFMFYANFNI